jgi:hypothetical protein
MLDPIWDPIDLTNLAANNIMSDRYTLMREPPAGKSGVTPPSPRFENLSRHAPTKRKA